MYVDVRISIDQNLCPVTILAFFADSRAACNYVAPCMMHICTHAVNNFQNITTELARRQEGQQESEELARMKEELNLELTRHDARMQQAR